jgi:hypothetical protein
LDTTVNQVQKLFGGVDRNESPLSHDLPRDVGAGSHICGANHHRSNPAGERRDSQRNGFVFQHSSGSHHLVTAHHVLKDRYEERTAAGEDLRFQVGGLPPLKPFSRFHMIDRENDIIRWTISAEEVATVCVPWSRVIVASADWATLAPKNRPSIVAGRISWKTPGASR